MSFIPGKLKPRIKPRLGVRVPGASESVDPPKNRPEYQSASVEPSIPKHGEDVSPPSIGETITAQEQLTQTLPIDETKSDTKCSSPVFNKDRAPISGSVRDSRETGELAVVSLARSDDEKTLGGSSVNLKNDNVVDENLANLSSLIAERSFSNTDADEPTLEFTEGQSVENTKDKVEIVTGLEAPLGEGKVSDADKTPAQCTVEQPVATDTSSADDCQKSHEISSIQKSNPKSTRPIGLKFHKPNLARLARSLTTNPSSQVNHSALRSDATPKPIDGTEKTQVGDQELSCPVSPLVQPDAFDSIAELSNQVPNSSPEAGEECPVDNSRVRIISDVACEKIISIEESSSVPDVGKNSAVGSVSSSSQIMGDMKPIDSNFVSVKTKTTSANDQGVFKKPPKIFKRAHILKSDRVKPRPDTPKTTVSSSTDERKSLEIIGDATASQENSDAENVTGGSSPLIDTTIDRNSMSTSPLSNVNVNMKNSSSTDLEKEEISDPNPRVPINPTVVPKAAPLYKTGKSTKGEADDAKVMYAISAVDYLKRHDHALGDSILRRFIIGEKNMENRSRKSTMCSTCNPQTLNKCLSSLWSFDKSELQTIIRKAAERHKAPSVSYAGLPGKTVFKPSLGRQRAPTLAASTYGKMSFEVKERLTKQYGPNPPELNKLRMLDLIFYNPADNQMSQSPQKSEQKPKSENDPDGRKIESRKAESTTGSDSESDPDDPLEEKDLDASSDSSKATSEPSVPVPQVRIGDEGQIILAPESLVMKKKETDVMNAPVVEEYSFSDSNRKKPNLDRTSWCLEETLKFYKALHSLGTDFSMMNSMFPNRTRSNLKSKFKREEKRNPNLIDKVMIAQGKILDFSEVEKDLTADKTLRRLALRSPSTASMLHKISEKKSWAKAELVNPGSAEKKMKSSNLRGLAMDVKKASNTDRDKDHSTDSMNPEATILNTISKITTEKNEDSIFKRPSNIRPPRKRKPVKSIPTIPEKRKKVESAGGKGLKETNDNGEDAIFKKPRIPKKRKAPQSSSSKRPNSPGPTQHLLSINLVDEEEDSDDTDDSASLEGADDECFIIKTDVKGHNYSYSRSVRVNFSDPEVPIDVNETIEHDRPQTPMSDSMSEADTEPGSDSEGGEEVEVVSIDMSEIESYLEKTGGVIIESLQPNDADDSPTTTDDTFAEDHLPITDEVIAEGPNDAVAEEPLPIMDEAVAEEPLPVMDHAVAEEPRPITDDAIAEEPRPITDDAIAEELRPITDYAVAEEPRPITDDAIAEEPLPITEDAIAEGPLPATDDTNVEKSY